MADEIEFIENYKTHVASAVIMMQVTLLPRPFCTEAQAPSHAAHLSV